MPIFVQFDPVILILVSPKMPMLLPAKSRADELLPIDVVPLVVLIETPLVKPVPAIKTPVPPVAAGPVPVRLMPTELASPTALVPDKCSPI